MHHIQINNLTHFHRKKLRSKNKRHTQINLHIGFDLMTGVIEPSENMTIYII